MIVAAPRRPTNDAGIRDLRLQNALASLCCALAISADFVAIGAYAAEDPGLATAIRRTSKIRGLGGANSRGSQSASNAAGGVTRA